MFLCCCSGVCPRSGLPLKLLKQSDAGHEQKCRVQPGQQGKKNRSGPGVAGDFSKPCQRQSALGADVDAVAAQMARMAGDAMLKRGLAHGVLPARPHAGQAAAAVAHTAHTPGGNAAKPLRHKPQGAYAPAIGGIAQNAAEQKGAGNKQQAQQQAASQRGGHGRSRKAQAKRRQQGKGKHAQT